MQTRQLRRAAERKTAKQSRTEINRFNSQPSTGSRTPEGKAASRQNAFRHGLYSTQLIARHEDPAELDALKAGLRAEHQPANTTEEILVNEMAEQFWRIRRFRFREACLLSIEDNEHATMAILKFLPIIQRFMTAAERGFHKALTALRQLQKDRGFVPQSLDVSQNAEQTEPIGSVPQDPPHEYSQEVNDWFNQHVADGTFSPEDTELRDFYEADLAVLQVLNAKSKIA